MTTTTFELPEDVSVELSNIAEQLKITPTQTVRLALSHFLQSETLANGLEGVARIDDGEALVDFPELKEELGIDIKFHALAMEELEELSEEEQVAILEEIIDRITTEDDELSESLDLVLKEEGENQVVVSEFSFGDVVYQIGNMVAIYHIAMIEDAEDEDEEDEEEIEGEVIENGAEESVSSSH